MADEHDDDLDSGSLRHVFSAMRAADEDPPARGLAELMAAARAHAPTPIPWWQRLAHVLRQPPTLALASIAILIGGALLIARPDATIEQVAPQPRSNVAPATAPLLPAPPPATSISAPHDEVRAKDAEPVRDPKPSVPRPRPHATPSAVGESAGRIQAPESETTAAPPKADALSNHEEERAQTQLLWQLTDRATSAAARGDCETAKALATRVAARDPAYYRDHVAIDAAVAKCLN